MNLKDFKNTSKSKQLLISNNVILHIVPEFESDVISNINKLGFQLHNCHSIIIKTKVLKLAGKTFDAREYNKKSKNQIKKYTTPITILNTLPKSINGQSQYFIIDNLITSQSSNYLYKMTSKKRSTIYLFNQLQKEFRFTKRKYPNFINYPIIIIDPYISIKNTDYNSIYNLIKMIPVIDLRQLACFDNHLLVALNEDNKKYTFLSILAYDKNGKLKINKTSLSYIKSSIDRIYKTLNKTSPILIKDKKEITKHNINFSNTIDIGKNNILSINTRKFNKLIKSYKINDPEIAKLIKNTIKNILITQSEIITADNIEFQILKAINKLVYGHDNIKEEHLYDPTELLLKLQDINEFKKIINIPPTREEYLFNINEIITIEPITSTVKKEYEFNENIHKKIKQLFSTLETRPDNPIKIQKIKHEIKDNNIHRFIQYTITLKNLTGNNKKPYDVILDIPALINDKYFKLNGNTYILANQQIFKPITKTKPTECRLLTNYSTATLSIVNLKFNISEFNEIIKYISIKYPKLIKSIDDNIQIIQFKDKNNSKINFIDEILFQNDNKMTVFDSTENCYYEIIEDNKIKIMSTKLEYIYEQLLEIVHTINHQENFKTYNRSIPYLAVHIMGEKMPLIIYMWQQIGLLNALTKLEINFSIDKKLEKDNSKYISFIFNNKKNTKLYLYPTIKRQELIINGLLIIPKKSRIFNIEDLNNSDKISDYLSIKGSSRTINNLNLATINILDPITINLLKYENYPINLITLISTTMVNILLNNKTTSITDLSNYRVRQSEIIFQLIYKELMQAHSTYSQAVNFGEKDAKAFLIRNYVIQCMLGAHPHMRGNSVLTLSLPYNPIIELKDDTKVIKTGPGGVPVKQQFKNSHRGIHKSHIGNIGANSTSEYEDVGLITHHTLSAKMNNEYGVYGTVDIKNASKWGSMTVDEACTPLINQMESGRAILAATHTAQVTAITDAEVPLVSSGFEYIVPQLSSKRFIHIAKNDGEIIEVVKDEFIKIRYKDKIDILDITPRLSRTKLASYINLEFKTLKKGTKVKKNQIIAKVDSFNDDAYVHGRNATIAVMNYLGYSHEDGYCISEKLSKQFQTKTTTEIVAIIPPNTKIIKFMKEKEKTNINDILLSFDYNYSVDSYIENYQLLNDQNLDSEIDPYELSDNLMSIKSPGGEIQHVKIFINNRDTTDPQLIKYWQLIIKKLKQKKKLYEQNYTNIDNKTKAIDNLDMTQLKIGGHKLTGGVEFKGVKIIYYISSPKILRKGDKLANRYGAKGLISNIISDDKTPYTKVSGPIDIFLSPISLFGRNNVANIKELYIGKIMWYLKEKIKKMPVKNAKILIIDVYTCLDKSKEQKLIKSISKKLNSISDNILKNKFKNGVFNITYIIEPFTNIDFKSIQNAANILKLELEEHVFIPELGVYTKNKVPVGKSYIQSLEAFGVDFESVRSSGKYTQITGQPVKGKKNFGGQSVGYLDVFNLLTYDANEILQELMTIRSDNIKEKRNMLNSIIRTGEYSLPESQNNKGKTYDLMNTFITSLGLKIS